MTALAKGNPSQAEALLRKSLEIFGDYIVGWDIARSLSYLGDVALMRGDLEEAQKTYSDALRSALEAKSLPVALDALAGLSSIQLQTGHPEGALEMACFIQNQPAGSQEARAISDRILVETGNLLDDDRVQTIREKSIQQSMDAIMNSFKRMGESKTKEA